MDILQPLPIDKWSLLRDSLKRDWPTYAYYYYFVNNAIKWKRKDPQYQLQIFCPNGDVDSGIFIGISTQSWYIVYMFSFKESRELLRRVLKESNEIDWNREVTFSAVHQHFGDVLENFVKEEGASKNIVLAEAVMTNNYFKPKEECLGIEVSVPKEYELRYLDESNIPLVHSVWPHRSIDDPKKSTDFLTSMVKLNRGIGLFFKQDDSLVSWVLHFDWGGLGMLQTLEEHKRKGFGKIVVKAMIKELAEEENLDSFLFVLDKNLPSVKLFESLGYQRLNTATWYFTRPMSSR